MIRNIISKFLQELDIKMAIAIIVIVIGILFFFNWLIIILLISITAIVSFALGRAHIRHLGIEFVAFTTIITGFVYGATAGLIIGFTLIILHLALAGFFGLYVVWTIPEYTAMGYIASIMAATQSITIIGITLVIGVNVLNMIITFILFRENSAKHIPWVVTNILFNILLFIFLAPPITGILK